MTKLGVRKMGKLTALHKNILKKYYINSILERPTAVPGLVRDLALDPEYARRKCTELETMGLLRKVERSYSLTSKGRSALTVVLVGGVFNIIHSGHIYTLTKAKSLGDLLVVSVARDNTVKKLRGSDPVMDESTRRSLVEAIKPVDLALLGSETDIFETVEKVRPQIIALGYDQKHREETVLGEAEKRGIRLRVVRLDSPIPVIKSSEIIKRIVDVD